MRERHEQEVRKMKKTVQVLEGKLTALSKEATSKKQ